MSRLNNDRLYSMNELNKISKALLLDDFSLEQIRFEKAKDILEGVILFLYDIHGTTTPHDVACAFIINSDFSNYIQKALIFDGSIMDHAVKQSFHCFLQESAVEQEEIIFIVSKSMKKFMDSLTDSQMNTMIDEYMESECYGS